MKTSLVPKAWQGYQFNAIQPQQTVAGRVIDKRTAKGTGQSNNALAAKGMGALAADDGYRAGADVDYFVTLKLQHGERKEFLVDADAYGRLTVGDRGSITYQGNWLLQFARHSERGWEVIQSQPQSNTFWGLVFLSLLVVVFMSLLLL